MRKIFKAAMVALLSFALVAVALPANADTSGGIGGGSGSGTSGYGSWRVAWNPNGSAWNTFFGVAGWSESTIANTGVNLDVCKRSQAIWWYAQPNSNKMYYQFKNGRTLDDNANQIRNIGTAPGVWNQRAADWTDWNIRRSSSAPYILICSAAIGSIVVGQADRPHSNTNTRTVNQDGKTQERGIYSYNTSITPQPLQNAAGQTVANAVGTKDFESQTGFQKTNFAAVYDDIIRNPKANNPSQIATKVNNAKVKDAAATNRDQVTLSPKNQAALAEGGVLNVSMYTTTNTIDTDSSARITEQQTCRWSEKWDSTNQRWYNTATTCDPWRETSRSTSYTSTKGLQTQRNLGFYQLLGVTCNQADFDALVNNIPGVTALERDQATGGTTSALARTRVYPEAPIIKDFGDARNTNAAAAKSGNVAFYDKECSVACTVDKPVGNSSGHPAAGNVGQTTNASNDGANFGARIENRNDNYFELFRDNSDNIVSLDVAYPVSSTWMQYVADAPKSTTVVRWAEGTPYTANADKGEDEANANAGSFNMSAVKLTPKGEIDTFKRLFTGENNKPATQKNFTVDAYDTANATTVSGFFKDFSMGATWVSDDTKPQVLNVNWEYPVGARSQIHANVGFNAQNQPTTGNVQSQVTTVDVRCYATFDGKQQGSNVAAVQANTGTGTVNNLDSALRNARGTQEGAHQQLTEPSNNLVVRFVRAIAG